jgi:carboxylate-amine ligase
VGVEEELLLVDSESGSPLPIGDQVITDVMAGHGTQPGRGGIEHELMREQVEIESSPSEDLAETRRQLTALRRELAAAAAELGAGVVALATCPTPALPTPVPNERYERMMAAYGLTAREQLTCGCHVHVSVGSPQEGVAVLDRIRPWLSVLAALSVNSPFWQGLDTGYASYRRMVWDRWPGSGPTEEFGTPEGYHGAVEAMVASGVLLDRGMVYFDARLSAKYPTVEIRVADVCADVADGILVAALSRALVDTAARDWRSGLPVPVTRMELLRSASWRSARSGLSGDLIDAVHGVPVRAGTMLERLLEHVADAVRRNGDQQLVDATVQRLLTRGSGADLQRAAYAKRDSVQDVVTDAIGRFCPD